MPAASEPDNAVAADGASADAVPADCLLCREVAQSIPLPGGQLVAVEHAVGFHLPPVYGDVYLGHLMVTPRRHADGFADLTDDEAADVGRAISRLSHALKAIRATRVYTMTVGHNWPHLHVHLLPRWPDTPDDVRWSAVDEWPGAVRGGTAEIADLAARLVGRAPLTVRRR